MGQQIYIRLLQTCFHYFCSNELASIFSSLVITFLHTKAQTTPLRQQIQVIIVQMQPYVYVSSRHVFIIYVQTNWLLSFHRQYTTLRQKKLKQFVASRDEPYFLFICSCVSKTLDVLPQKLFSLHPNNSPSRHILTDYQEPPFLLQRYFTAFKSTAPYI